MSQSKVNAKLYKSKKVDLKTLKVDLNALDGIREALDASSTVGYVLEESLPDAYDEVRRSNDFIDHQFHQDFMWAEEQIVELETTLDDLGIPYPPELVEMKGEHEYQREQINELIDMMDLLKNTLGGQGKY